LNNRTNANNAKAPPTKILCYRDIHTPSGLARIDTETKTGHIKFARSRSGLQTSRAANDGAIACHAEITGFDNEHKAYDGQVAHLKDNVETAIPRHSSMSATTQQPLGRGSIKVNGHFPRGTNLEISTDDSITKIVATDRDVLVSDVSKGWGSFQFFGDSEHAVHSFLTTYMFLRKRES
jgi:hypothetical protein